MAGATVRGYRPVDEGACRVLWADLTQWHRDLYGDQDIGGENPGHHFDAHRATVGSDHMWVAEVGGKVVGMAGLIPKGDEGELEPLVVAPGFRGQGIGHRLVEAVVAAARASGLRYLQVRPVGRNIAALRYFHDLGFDILGQVELFMDLGSGEGPWKPQEELAGRSFRA